MYTFKKAKDFRREDRREAYRLIASTAIQAAKESARAVAVFAFVYVVVAAYLIAF